MFTMAWRLLKLCSGLVRGTKVTLPYTQTHTHKHTDTYTHRHTDTHTQTRTL
jgi:hypothetical protein